MFLSHKKISSLIKENKIQITPQVIESDIRPNSIRLYLDHTLITYTDQTIDPTKKVDPQYKKINISDTPFTLKPGCFVLGSTTQTIKTPPEIIGFLDGRSTLARLGLMIHVTAAVTDSLYEDARSITLEIFNAGNLHIILSHNMAIGALLFAQLDQPVTQKVQEQYKGQQRVHVSNLKDQFS